MSLDPLTAGIDLAKTAIDKIWPDAGEAERAKMNAVLAVTLGQLEVNKAEAGSTSTFVAGWRPAIGWICGAALAFHYILRPLLPWLIGIFGMQTAAIPALDLGDLMTILFGMLGLGALRTTEKVKGVA